MPKDFAGRSSTARRKPSKPKNRRGAVSPKARVLFHGPSFSSGAIVGGAIVILAAYAPEWLALGDANGINRRLVELGLPDDAS